MKTSAVKKIWWVVFAVSLERTVNLIASAIRLRNSLEDLFTTWSAGVAAIAALILLPLGIFRLRSAYRREPSNWTGRWHLSIIDFYVVVLFAAAVMSGWYLAGREKFIGAGIQESMFLSIGFLVCLLFAARIGCGVLPLRIHYALALALTFYGTMALGLMLLYFAEIFKMYVLSSFGPVSFRLSRALKIILYEFKWIVVGEADNGRAIPTWILMHKRLALLSLPVGLLLLHWAKKRLARAQAEAVAR